MQVLRLHPRYDEAWDSLPSGACSASHERAGCRVLVTSLFWFYGIGSILALFFGYKARKEIDGSRGTQTGRGMATAGIVLGWIGIVGTLIFAAGALVLLSSDEWLGGS